VSWTGTYRIRIEFTPDGCGLFNVKR